MHLVTILVFKADSERGGRVETSPIARRLGGVRAKSKSGAIAS